MGEGSKNTISRRLLVWASNCPWLRNLYSATSHLPGVGGILRCIVRRALPYGTRVWVQVRNGLGKGLWLRLDPRYELNYWNGDYEPEIQNLLAGRLRPGDVLYDIGAHIGFFSLIAARLVGKEGAVFAFEPDPENVARIEEHIQRNELNQVQVVPLAVWSASEQRLYFQRASEFSSRSTGAIVQTPTSTGIDVIEVQTITLDEFVQNHRPPNLVKVDVEGGESEVLKGAIWTFEIVRPLLICEVHDEANRQFVTQMLKGKYVFLWLDGEAAPFPKRLFAMPC
ncbi:methyltransferase, FkbM family [Candidatus Fervidibacteria bacterium JGI MDM2 JNZ-1-D12]